MYTSVPGCGRLNPPLFPAKAAMGSVHKPVLVDEIASWLSNIERPGAILLDGTAGGGGHLVAMVRRLGPGGKAIGLDRDPGMLSLAREAVAGAGVSDRVSLVHAAFSEMRDVLNQIGIEHADAIILDLGLSSDQLAGQDRGFSFTSTGPLDMRFDPRTGPTAAEMVNRPARGRAGGLVLRVWRGALFSRRIARQSRGRTEEGTIARPSQLAAMVRGALPGRARHGPIDPATRVFQALRIVGQRRAGPARRRPWRRFPSLLSSGGRAAVISFHSLEDRRVKWAFRNRPELTVLTKKPVTATAQEVAVNPRARSAKLRVVETMPEPVVIIGPASGPAGPISGQPDSPASTDAAAVAAPEPAARTAEPPKKTAAIAAVAMVALRIVGIVLSLLQRAAWAIGRLLIRVIRQYPRHSLAAGASLLILGGIFYTQSAAPKNRRATSPTRSQETETARQRPPGRKPRKLPPSPPPTRKRSWPASPRPQRPRGKS